MFDEGLRGNEEMDYNSSSCGDIVESRALDRLYVAYNIYK